MRRRGDPAAQVYRQPGPFLRRVERFKDGIAAPAARGGDRAFRARGGENDQAFLLGAAGGAQQQGRQQGRE
ncbi:MAG: hypothetical protein CVU79_12085 [Elusimicrobia bacterium HGW-Elusimicrobia-3]|nr:MAG: hypothetical protein CVU79_12085 [Elusimicrobia bacterium HGW-Elusimicrobia-3]